MTLASMKESSSGTLERIRMFRQDMQEGNGNFVGQKPFFSIKYFNIFTH